MKNKINHTCWLLLLSTLLLTGCQNIEKKALTSPQVPEGSQIKDLRTGEILTPDALMRTLSHMPMVIVGEEHTNAAHHDIELWLLQNMQQQRPQGSVLMEMLAENQQPLASALQQELHRGKNLSDQQIQQTLNWNPGWPWQLYGELVTTALQSNAPLLSANITRSKITEIYRNPGFPTGKNSSAKHVREALSAIIFTMHGGELAPEQMNAMLAIQQNRDRFMAQQLLNAPRPALMFVGGFHAAKQVGVPLHIADLNGDTPTVLMLSTLGTTISAEQADYVWFVPALPK